jgi:prepilin-type processing-associated H-X9-DG protein
MPADGVDGSFTTSGTLYTQRSVVWGCPVWLHRDWKKYWPTSNLTKPSYGMNSNPWLSDSWNGTNWVNSPANSRNLFMASVSLRSQRMLYGDAIDWHLAVNAAKTAFADTNNGIRHEGRANYVFFDGHVASLMPAVAVNAIGNPGAVP